MPDNEVLKTKRKNVETCGLDRIRRVFFPCAFVPSITIRKRERDKEHSRKLSPSAVAHRSRPVSVLVTFKFTSRPSTTCPTPLLLLAIRTARFAPAARPKYQSQEQCFIIWNLFQTDGCMALDRRIVCGIPPAVTAISIRTGFNFFTFDQRPIVIAGEKKTGVGGLNFGTGRRILQIFYVHKSCEK